jgi:hypothetical protein
VKKILFAIMVCVIAIGLIGGAFSAFTAARTSSNNIFTAGVAALRISNGSGWVADDSVVIGSAANMAPGQEIGPMDVYFQNNGTTPGNISVTTTYTLATISGTPPEGTGAGYATATADQFAGKMIVTNAVATLDSVDISSNIAGYWAQQIIDEKFAGNATNAINAWYVVSDGSGYLPTILGLSQITLYYWNNYSDKTQVPLAVGHYYGEKMTIKLSQDVGNPYMWTGINISMTATITSVP